MTSNETTEQRNAAIHARRLMNAYVDDPQTGRCHQCGDLLHPFPKPEHWMQYPLPECCVIDGLRFCYSFRKPGCVDAYLTAHPTPAAAGKKTRTRSGSVQPGQVAGADRARRLAAIANVLPPGEAELLAASVAAVASGDVAVVAGDRAAASLAADYYEAIVLKLNGGTHHGSFGNEESAGRVVERYCQAPPGVVPIWGQAGDFVLTVEGVRCRVEFGRGFGSALRCHYAFHAVDLDGRFTSETGYRSYFDEVRFGQSVVDAASAIVRHLLRTQRRYLMLEARERLARDPLPACMMSLQVSPRRLAAHDALLDKETPPGFALVDVVLTN